MTAGLNIRIRIERDHYSIDPYGGAEIVSGSIVADNIAARFDPGMPKSLVNLIQGNELEKYGTFIIKPIQVAINSKYRIRVIRPVAPWPHLNYFDTWEVLGIEYSSIHPADRRGFLGIGVLRIEPYRSGTFSP